jgi:hypothetical protein
MSDTYNISLRMPPELGEAIQKIAKKDKRPMNTTIVLLLQAAVKEKNRKRYGKKVRIPDFSPDICESDTRG